jgi:5'-methylthioadenosine phosphorylase
MCQKFSFWRSILKTYKIPKQEQQDMEQVKIGVIGGSGVYHFEKLTDISEIDANTPFGQPSDKILIGTLAGQRVAFLARHGRGHRISPGEVNFRANIYALKQLGVEFLIAISACGSLKMQYAPRHIVIPDQIFDFTKKRVNSFFSDGLVAHVSLADPFCPELSALLATAVEKTGATVHRGASYITVEGPRFSSKAESNTFRSWGMGIIGMTGMPEAALAREAEMCYAMMAHVTDYDCWHEEEAAVTVEMVIANLMANASVSKQAIENLVPEIQKSVKCSCSNALAAALITQRDLIPVEIKQKLDLLICKYI